MEKLLDVGTIAIVPVVGEFTIPTTWRCAVLDESRNMDTVYQFLDKTFIRVKASPYSLYIKVYIRI